MNYVLIGMPGSGKTTIGKLLAKELTFDFIDSDHYLEATSTESIAQMFEKGESYFREQETRVLEQIAQMDQLVIATGGGAILVEKNIKVLKNNGLIIFLDRTPDAIVQDIVNEARPLLAEDKYKLYNLYEERIELYRRYADLIIKNDQSATKICQLILQQIDHK